VVAALQASPGRHCHSTLPLSVVDCHCLGIYIRIFAVTFCQNDSVAVLQAFGSDHARAIMAGDLIDELGMCVAVHPPVQHPRQFTLSSVQP
jgi:hypothetical protein